MESKIEGIIFLVLNTCSSWFGVQGRRDVPEHSRVSNNWQEVTTNSCKGSIKSLLFAKRAMQSFFSRWSQKVLFGSHSGKSSPRMQKACDRNFTMHNPATNGPIASIGNYQFVSHVGEVSGYQRSYIVREIFSREHYSLHLSCIDLLSSDEIDAIIRSVFFSRFLRHPAILDYSIIYTESHYIWALSDRIISESLRSIIDEHYPDGMSEKAVVNILESVIRGIQYVHQKKIVHGDIRAKNILITSSFNVKITGFAYSYEISKPFSRLGYPEMRLESIQWAPYEAIINIPHSGTLADIYMIGVTTLEILFGNTPYEGCGVIETIYRKLFYSVCIDTEIMECRKISKELIEIISNCLQKRPKDRPSLSILLNNPILKRNKKPSIFERQLLKTPERRDLDFAEFCSRINDTNTCD